MACNCDELVGKTVKPKLVLIDCLKRWRLTCSCSVNGCGEVLVSHLNTAHL